MLLRCDHSSTFSACSDCTQAHRSRWEAIAAYLQTKTSERRRSERRAKAARRRRELEAAVQQAEKQLRSDRRRGRAAAQLTLRDARAQLEAHVASFPTPEVHDAHERARPVSAAQAAADRAASTDVAGRAASDVERFEDQLTALGQDLAEQRRVLLADAVARLFTPDAVDACRWEPFDGRERYGRHSEPLRGTAAVHDEVWQAVEQAESRGVAFDDAAADVLGRVDELCQVGGSWLAYLPRELGGANAAAVGVRVPQRQQQMDVHPNVWWQVLCPDRVLDRPRTLRVWADRPDAPPHCTTHALPDYL